MAMKVAGGCGGETPNPATQGDRCDRTVQTQPGRRRSRGGGSHPNRRGAGRAGARDAGGVRLRRVDRLVTATRR